MHFPYLHVLDDEWVPGVGPDARHALAEVEAIQPIAVRLVALEAHKGQGANVDALLRPIGLLDAQARVESTRLRRLEAVAVAAVLARHVAREGVEAVGPPEAGAVVLIERQRLARQGFGAE